MNYVNSNNNISKNNRRVKPQKNKNNFNKSSKLRKNEIKSKICINYTDKNSKIIYTNSNNAFYNSIDFPSTTTSTNRTNLQLYLPYKDCIKTSLLTNKSNSKKINLGLSNSNKIISFNGFNTNNIQNSSRKKFHNIELITSHNKSEKKINNKNIFINDRIKEKDIKINKLKKDLALSEMILNDLKYKDNNKKLQTMENTKHIGNITYDKSNSCSLRTENYTKNKKMLTINLNDNNFFNKKGNSYTNIASLLTFNYINNNFPHKKNYYKSLSPQNKPIKNNFFSYRKDKNAFIRQNIPLIHTQKNLQREKIKQFFESDFFEFKEKCEKLQKRTKNILNKYIKLSESLYK